MRPLCLHSVFRLDPDLKCHQKGGWRTVLEWEHSTTSGLRLCLRLLLFFFLFLSQGANQVNGHESLS